MSDIDFDELDKAVNNLMGKTQNQHDDSAVSASTPNIDPPVPVQSGGEAHQIERVGLPDVQAGELPKMSERPVIAPRPKPSTGRFMDVVHPSADMRSAAAMTAQRPTQSVTMPALTSPQNGSKIPDEITEEMPQTPFLPDANTKVQKRPLGAIQWSFDQESSEQADQVNETTDSTTTTDNTTGPTKEDEQPVETTPINADFKHQETKISDDDKNLDQPPIDPTQIETELTDQDRVLQSIESAPVDDTDAPAHEDATVRSVESGDTEHLRDDGDDAKVKESDKIEESGAIYDVKNYHQPLHHPAKQKSGWGTVVIILAIIVICIALAAAAFFVFGGGLQK